MDEIIEVITEKSDVDDGGYPTFDEIAREEVYATVNSADYRDFWASYKENIEAKIEFEIRREDFDSLRITKDGKHYYPTKVIYDEATYDLFRWRYKGKDRAVLICG